jgi:Spy/CpxP family protein refolding chaperone
MAAMFHPYSKEFTMKTWIRRTLLGVFAGSLLIGGLAACSHQRAWPTNEADAVQWRERMLDRAARELSLDDAQKAKLAGLADAVKAQRNALVGSAADPRAELQALVAGAQFDRARAQALLEAKTGAVRDKAPAVLDAMAGFYDSLKPEQQQKVRDWMARGRHHGFGRG